MMEKALLKIRKEMEENKDQYVKVIGDYLINYINKNPDTANSFCAEGKTIKGSIAVMKEEARKQQKGGVAVLTDEEGFKIILDYFGISDKNITCERQKPSRFSVDLDTLLK